MKRFILSKVKGQYIVYYRYGGNTRTKGYATIFQENELDAANLINQRFKGKIELYTF